MWGGLEEEIRVETSSAGGRRAWRGQGRDGGEVGCGGRYRGGVLLVSWCRVVVVWTGYLGLEEEKGGGRRLYSVREQQQE